MAIARRAEAIGFDSVWVQDHLLFRFPGQETEGPWESFALLAGLAAATERVELGTLVQAPATVGIATNLGAEHLAEQTVESVPHRGALDWDQEGTGMP